MGGKIHRKGQNPPTLQKSAELYFVSGWPLNQSNRWIPFFLFGEVKLLFWAEVPLQRASDGRLCSLLSGVCAFQAVFSLAVIFPCKAVHLSCPSLLKDAIIRQASKWLGREIACGRRQMELEAGFRVRQRARVTFTCSPTELLSAG